MTMGNSLIFLGCLLMVYVGLVKKKDRVIYLQCVQFGLMGIGSVMLGSPSAGISNAVGIARNVVFAKTGSKKWANLLFTLVIVVTTLFFMPSAEDLRALQWLPTTVEVWLVWWLPVAAFILLTVGMEFKSVVTFKIFLIVSQIAWMIHDYLLGSWALPFDVAMILATLWSVFSLRRAAKRKA